MSRFVDPASTRTVDFGECLCPGAPHESDFATIKGEASYADTVRFLGAQQLDDDGKVGEALAGFITGWNLLGPNGQAWPPSADSLMALKIPTLTALIAAIGAVVNESSELPNASGAPSAASSRGSASATRKSKRTPTT